MEIHWAVVFYFLKYDKNGQILSVYFNIFKTFFMIFGYPLIFYRSMIDLSILCCASFRCRAKVIQLYVYAILFQILLRHRL